MDLNTLWSLTKPILLLWGVVSVIITGLLWAAAAGGDSGDDDLPPTGTT